ncbi:hypothetical protein LCGC14_2944620 [marine sediment metagenome]|uniref:Uncharacterized protein n=1 Tax=marine sediment metagenome TaxID=412755 RepID=A0A0F9A840_9ZZZZ
MPIQEKELKGILKSLKAINAALGATAGADLLADVDALIVAETATNAILDSAVTAEGVVNANVDLIVALVGTGATGTLSFADQTQLLQNVIP